MSVPVLSGNDPAPAWAVAGGGLRWKRAEITIGISAGWHHTAPPTGMHAALRPLPTRAVVDVLWRAASHGLLATAVSAKADAVSVLAEAVTPTSQTPVMARPSLVAAAVEA
jgi:hypothetical protein